MVKIGSLALLISLLLILFGTHLVSIIIMSEGDDTNQDDVDDTNSGTNLRKRSFDSQDSYNTSAFASQSPADTSSALSQQHQQSTQLTQQRGFLYFFCHFVYFLTFFYIF